MVVTRIIDHAVIMPALGATQERQAASQPLTFLAALATFIPSLAVAARRLHDTGRSAWWLVIGLVPLLGTLVLLYFFVQPGVQQAD